MAAAILKSVQEPTALERYDKRRFTVIDLQRWWLL